MNTNIILTALVTFLIGVGGGYFIGNSPDNNHLIPDGTEMHGSAHSDMESEMEGMMAALDDKNGDEFDKAFLKEMIVHHQGAVEMAEAALQNAKHEEIQNMAHAIIAAQTAEIQQMQGWQTQWYGAE